MSVSDLMLQIVDFDCDPGVYNVAIVKAQYRSGFDVNVTFRSTNPDALSGISAHNDDPEKALETIIAQLKERWGKCPHCGNHRHESRTA